MRAPDFWWAAKPTPTARLLSPLCLLWAAGARLNRLLHRPVRAPVPVISVGNLVVGGAGKTPVALAVLDRLNALGIAGHAIGTGHGGSHRGPHRVAARQDSARHVGDEALLLAARGTTWIGRDRLAAARAATLAGAAAIVLDDGHQQRDVLIDLALLVIDAETGFGNGLLMPAGPLRETAKAGLARGHAFILMGDEPGSPLPADRPVLRARLVAEPQTSRFRGEAVVAFAGIARPAKFFRSLAGAGARVCATASFPDHHTYAADEIMRLVETASAEKATLVTTTKDWVRLPREARNMVEVFPVHCQFEDEAALDRLLLAACRA